MHRKHFQDLTSRTTFHIKKSVIPYVVALGELDPYRTVPVKLWRAMERPKGKFPAGACTRIREDKVFGIHLRGTSLQRI